MCCFDEMIKFQNVDSFVHPPGTPLSPRARKELHIIIDVDRVADFHNNHGNPIDIAQALLNTIQPEIYKIMKPSKPDITMAMKVLENALAQVKAAL